MQDLGTLGGDFSESDGVSADGSVVVGHAWNTASEDRVFRWSGRVISCIDTRDACNELHHNTHKYTLSAAPGNDESRTLLRRGSKPSPHAGTADFDVIVAECFDPAQHRLSFEAQHTFDGVVAVRDVAYYDQQVPSGHWGCVMREPLGPPINGERIVKMRLFTPPDAAVGQYIFRAVVKDPMGNRLEDKAFEHPVVILFNPWDSDDTVSVESPRLSAAEIEEYVMNERGAWWEMNRTDSPPQIGWVYQQFGKDVFLGTLELLSGLNGPGGLSEAERRSPSAVTRFICDRVNERNDNGMLIDCWQVFGCPVDPRRYFRSSAQEIFRGYRTTGAPVRYGQCHIFAGCAVAALRSLGIPSRTVSVDAAGIDKDSPPNLQVEQEFCEVLLPDGSIGMPPAEVNSPNCPIASRDLEFVVAETFDAEWVRGDDAGTRPSL